MKIEIWSDIVCPWCYIGKRRFEAALAQFAHRDEVDVVWRSFELNPNAQHRAGERLTETLAQKFGMTATQVEALHEKLTALAAEVGLEYHLDRAQPSSTFDAHRLLHLAARHDLQGTLKERLMQAYFTDGLPIGAGDTLLDLGTAVGLEADDVRRVLETDGFADEVRADERRASLFGIRGVPFFAIDEQYGISGAQPTSHILSVLEHVWAASREHMAAGTADTEANGEGDACAPSAQRA